MSTGESTAARQVLSHLSSFDSDTLPQIVFDFVGTIFGLKFVKSLVPILLPGYCSRFLYPGTRVPGWCTGHGSCNTDSDKTIDKIIPAKFVSFTVLSRHFNTFEHFDLYQPKLDGMADRALLRLSGVGKILARPFESSPSIFRSALTVPSALLVGWRRSVCDMLMFA
eukprot:1677337-Rhodomonas_salina.2